MKLINKDEYYKVGSNLPPGSQYVLWRRKQNAAPAKQIAFTRNKFLLFLMDLSSVLVKIVTFLALAFRKYDKSMYSSLATMNVIKQNLCISYSSTDVQSDRPSSAKFSTTFSTHAIRTRMRLLRLTISLLYSKYIFATMSRGMKWMQMANCQTIL